MSKLLAFLLVAGSLAGAPAAWGDEAVFRDIVGFANRLYQRGGPSMNVVASHRLTTTAVSALPRQVLRPLEGERFRQALSHCVFMRQGATSSHLTEREQAAALAEFELFLERMRTRGVREYFRLDAPSFGTFPLSAPLQAPCVFGVVVGQQVLLLRAQSQPR